MFRYIFDKENMVITDTKENCFVCLVDTKRPDLLENKLGELLALANVNYKAIDILKEVAFVDIDSSLNERLKVAKRAQELLRQCGYGEWIDEQIKINIKEA